MTKRTAFRTKYKEPVADADATGHFHVYPSLTKEVHEIHPACWCFPERKVRDENGLDLRKPIFIHNDFGSRGNA